MKSERVNRYREKRATRGKFRQTRGNVADASRTSPSPVPLNRRSNSILNTRENAKQILTRIILRHEPMRQTASHFLRNLPLGDEDFPCRRRFFANSRAGMEAFAWLIYIDSETVFALP
ncbi:MAG: hypothetical protein U0805_00380 [Pirellulales bacterium]